MFRWVDGFDMYQVDDDLLRRYNGERTRQGIITTGGRYGGGCLSGQDASSNGIYVRFIDQTEEIDGVGNGNTIAVAFHFKQDADLPPSSTAGLLRFINSTHGNPAGSTNNGWEIGMSSVGGTMYVEQWGGGTDYVGSTDVCDGNWHWIELRLKADNTNGIAECYVDGILQFQVLGDTVFSNPSTNYTASILRIGTSGGFGSSIRIDDLMIWDDAAGSAGDKNAATDFPLGVSQVELLYPTGAGSSTQWTPSQGQNWECVNEQVPNETDFVTTTTIGALDTYQFGNMVNNPATIHSVCVQMHARDNQSIGTTLRSAATNGGSTGFGSTRPFTPTYLTRASAIGQDPNTNAAWTVAGVNSSEFGIEKP